MTLLRKDKPMHFLEVALQFAHQGTCLRRNYGAIIVDGCGTIVSTGYTGQPCGKAHCKTCWRQDHNIPSGSNYERCFSVHAEQNALLQAGKKARGCTMYIAGYEVATGDEIVASEPCFICSKLMVNAGISEIITKHDPKMIQENDERRKQGYVVCEVEPFKVETMDAVYEKMAKKVLQA